MNDTKQLSSKAALCLHQVQRGRSFAWAIVIGLVIGLLGVTVPWSEAWAKPDSQEVGRGQMGMKSRAQRNDLDRAQNQTQIQTQNQAQIQAQNQAQNQAQAEARAQNKAVANQAARDQRQDAMRQSREQSRDQSRDQSREQSRDQLRDQVREQQDARRRDAAAQPSQLPVGAPQEARAGQRLSPEERQVLRDQLRAARKIQLP